MVELDPSPTCAPAAGIDASTDAMEALGLELGRLGRITHVMKTRTVGLTPPGLDHAALGVLMTLCLGGPRRQGELADATLLDPSTVSRHVAQLVKAGLVERRADAADGRAVQLVASTAGDEFANALVGRRRAMIEDVLGGWSVEDVETLARLLRRFNDELEGSRDVTALRSTAPSTTDSTTESQEN